MPQFDRVTSFFSSSKEAEIYYINDNSHDTARKEYKRTVIESLELGDNIKLFTELVSNGFNRSEEAEYLCKQFLKGKARLNENSLEYEGKSMSVSRSNHFLLSESYDYRNKIKNIHTSPPYGGEIWKEANKIHELRKKGKKTEEDIIDLIAKHTFKRDICFKSYIDRKISNHN